MAYRVPADQESEYRRLVQKANRRVQAYMEEYEEEGRDIVPADVAPGRQTREQWDTENTPFSRSLYFESEEDYLEKLQQLKDIEQAETKTKFAKTQRNKLEKAIETIIGEVPEEWADAIGKMNSAQIANFWEIVEEKSRKLGLKYSSDSVIIETLEELYEEDLGRMVMDSLDEVERLRNRRARAEGKRKKV